MITKKRTIGFLLIVGLLTVIVASAYAAGGNPFDRLEAKILALENRIALLEALPLGEPGFGPPDYDSDWRPINKAGTMSLEHGLGTTDLFIYVIGTSSSGHVINHNYYGYFNDKPAGIRGLKWEATSTHITLRRGGYDWDWENVRVYIWIIPTNLVDTDSDGLSDILEIEVYGTDPTDPDSDGDGLSDYDEIMVYGTNPMNEDTDNDGYWDGEEVDAGSDPLAYHSTPGSP